MITRTSKIAQAKEPRTYREQRFNRTILTTIALIATCNPWLVILSHPLASIFWDWWFYSFRGAKESSRLPEWFLEMRSVSPQQVDRYTDFVVKTKRITFAVALIAGAIGIAIKTPNSLFAFWGIYYGGMFLVVTIAIVCRFIRLPYFIGGSQSNFRSRATDYNDLTNPLNPIGYFNTVSPNYIHRGWR